MGKIVSLITSYHTFKRKRALLEVRSPAPFSKRRIDENAYPGRMIQTFRAAPRRNSFTAIPRVSGPDPLSQKIFEVCITDFKLVSLVSTLKGQTLSLLTPASKSWYGSCLACHTAFSILVTCLFSRFV